MRQKFFEGHKERREPARNVPVYVEPDDPERSMVRLRLKRRRYDGRQHLDFTQIEFVGHIFSLVPRPWHNLIRYHGVFAPNHAWRDFIVPHHGRPRLGLSMDCDMLGKRSDFFLDTKIVDSRYSAMNSV